MRRSIRSGSVTWHPASVRVVDLSGEWRAHPSDAELAKSFAAPATPDNLWENVRVPHHWRTEPAFDTSDGPLLYRHRFDFDTSAERRVFLELGGIFYYGDVWLDGEYLGATEGWFAPNTFDITTHAAARTEHLLAIEVACPPQHDRGAKRTLTGPYWQPPLLDPELNPGGIWRPVRVLECGAIRIERARAVCVEASVEQGRLGFDITLDAAQQCEAVVRTRVEGPGGVSLFDDSREATLAAGSNTLAWTIAIDEPPRWWPRGFGPQSLCTTTVTVETNGSVSDGRQWRTAFREVRRERDAFLFNGERVYLKGAAYGPTRPLLGDVTSEDVRRDVELAIAANLDFLRVFTHVAPDSLYDAADELGLLLWQDFPMHGGYARGVRKQATRQARTLVDLLGHHPSIFTWCAHDAPLGDDTPARLLATAAAPTWGKEVLDRAVARAISRADPTRPVIRHSGDLNEAHAWFGWLHGALADLGPAIRTVPRIGRLLAKFGAQSVPTSGGWMHPERWPHLDWDELAERHGMQRPAFNTHVPAMDAKSFDEWRDATQSYQAALLQLQIEDLRRCRHDPSAGFAVFTLVDPMPAIGYGIVDHERVPKRAYAAVRDACRPLLPMVDPRSGSVHIANDTRAAFTNAVITVTADGRTRRWQGDVGPGSLTYIGSVELDDAIDVEAVVEHEKCGRVVNRYPLLILESSRS
jgi:beta-mannosidase